MPQIPHFILTVDVGNSRIKCGLFDHAALGSNAIELPHCLYSATVPADRTLHWDEIRHWLEENRGCLAAGIVAGVNPAGVKKVFEDWPGDDWPSPLVVDGPQRLPLLVNLPAADEVGIDRLLNAVAANAIRPLGRPVIIVDTGTATTVDYLSVVGVFEGGAILPGFELSARALHQYTALLPLIDVETLNDGPSPQPVGRNTDEALRSGLYWGQLGAVKELIDRMATSFYSHSENLANQPPETTLEISSPLLILTGGGSTLLKPHLPDARWEPKLGLQGLALVAAELNK